MPTALIIGAGPRLGPATVKAFVGAGYNVVTASRSVKTYPQSKHITFDASQPNTVTKLFEEVRAAAGDPSVVVYTGVLA
jgi:NAD(P)-dependent dehydrogenase (short-subunit alcohol dehydrogenase family)